MVLNINAPTFQSVLAGGYTATQAHNFLKQRFIDCGWGSPIGEVFGGTNITVWSLAFNPNTPQGTVRVSLETYMTTTVLTVRLRLHTAGNYNSVSLTGTTATGANNVLGSTFTCSNVNSLITYAIPISEQITGISLIESPATFKGFLGVAYPTLESWYDENQWCGVMLVQPILPNNFWSPYPNPSGATGTTAIVSRSKLDTFATRNPFNSVVQIIKAPYITCNTYGISAKFNDSIGICNNSGLAINDINVVSPNTEEWWNLWTGDNGIAIRSI